MNYRGDVWGGCRIAGSFTTVTTTGAPTAISATANSLCVVAYKLLPADATGFTCSTAGITLSTNCSGRTGWNTWQVNTGADGTFYSCGHDFELVLQGGTVGGTCVSGYMVASFSIKNRAALLPMDDFARLEVTQSGAANINWAGVENCTNATTLTCTSIFTADHLVQKPVIDACSTVFSVTSVLNDIHKISDVSNIGAGSAPSANSIACTVWNSLRSDYGTCGTFGYLLDCSVSSRLAPEFPGRTLAVTSVGTAGVDWGRVSNCTTVQNLTCTSVYVADHLVQRPIVDSCSAIFSVRKLIDPPVIDACSTVFSVRSVLNDVPGVTAGVTVTTNNDKTGYALSVAGINCLTSATITEPANVPGWPMSVCTALGWLAAIASNCITQTATTQSVCNRATSTTIASAPITCTSTIVHRGTFGAVIP